jgi:cell division septation protein DedD
MEHSMVTFRLHRKGVIFIIFGSILAAVLLFAGGYLVAMRRRPAAPTLPVTASAPPASSTAVPAASAPAPKTDLLAVRVGVFDTEEDAKAMVQQLAARKLEAVVVPMTTTDGIKLYTVEAGQYDTRAAASAAASSLAEEHGLHTAVVPAGGEAALTTAQ